LGYFFYPFKGTEGEQGTEAAWRLGSGLLSSGDLTGFQNLSGLKSCHTKQHQKKQGENARYENSNA